MSDGLDAKHIFRQCWGAYRRLRAKTGGTPGTDTTKPKLSAPPHVHISPADYCADFAAIGARSLDRPIWSSRLALFLSYHVRLEPYDEARRRLGISRGTMNYWLSAIAETAGQAMLEAGLWPPGRYLR